MSLLWFAPADLILLVVITFDGRTWMEVWLAGKGRKWICTSRGRCMWGWQQVFILKEMVYIVEKASVGGTWNRDNISISSHVSYITWRTLFISNPLKLKPIMSAAKTKGKGQKTNLTNAWQKWTCYWSQQSSRVWRHCGTAPWLLPLTLSSWGCQRPIGRKSCPNSPTGWTGDIKVGFSIDK